MRGVLTIGCVLFASPAAVAQGDTQTVDARAQDKFQDAKNRYRVLAGAGFEAFVGSEMREIAKLGPAWNVRVSWGNRKAVSFEIGYAGSRQPLEVMGVRGNLVANGAQAMLRVNVAPELTVEPFFFIGGGWSRFSMTDYPVDTPYAISDDVLEFPAGVGVAYSKGALQLDLRAGYRVITAADMIPMEGEGSEDSALMHRYGVTANVGYAF